MTGDNLEQGAASLVSPEQAAERAMLAASASDPLPSDNQNAEEQRPQPERLASHADEARMAVDMFAEMTEAYCPETKQYWPEDIRARVSVALAAVLAKYNFSLFRSPELMLLAVAGPPVWQTSKAIAAMMNGMKSQPAQPAAQPSRDNSE